MGALYSIRTSKDDSISKPSIFLLDFIPTELNNRSAIYNLHSKKITYISDLQKPVIALVSRIVLSTVKN